MNELAMVAAMVVIGGFVIAAVVVCGLIRSGETLSALAVVLGIWALAGVPGILKGQFDTIEWVLYALAFAVGPGIGSVIGLLWGLATRRPKPPYNRDWE